LSISKHSSSAPNSTFEDLFAEDVVLDLPTRFALRGRVNGNVIEQVLVPAGPTLCKLRHFSVRRVGGWEANLATGELLRVIVRKTSTKIDADLLLLAPGAGSPRQIAEILAHSTATWLKPIPIKPDEEDRRTASARVLSTIKSWDNAFKIKEGHAPEGSVPASPGLRRPQVGALHAALAHATRSTEPATIVMPTGTGKTETMLALQVVQAIECLLVVVPTDALRDQIAGKFATLGVLKAQECLASQAGYPVVLRLSHRPRTAEEVDEIFDRANVVVTTMQVVGQAPAEVQERMAQRVKRLFIDEAHHIGARTWADFRSLFAELNVPIIQFTATPFREDGRRVDGEFIYTYPLKKAQQEGYFKRIRFDAVFGLDREDADAEIITKVGEVLEADLIEGLNHLAMARCQTIERAKSLHERYLARYPEYRPVLVHSQQPSAMRRANLAALRRFDSRIIVCVDMLGEGFDLPELKIAALHDHHKSIAVTIQFVGRFTRQDSRLGDATVIANTGMDDLDRALAKLYAEDADWNALVEALSTSNIERQVRRSEMFKGFVGNLEDIPLQTLDPKMNAFVYITHCSQWDPLHAEDLYDAGVFLGMKINQQKRVAVFVTREELNARWTTAHHVMDVTWNLHLLHWDETRGLLFIGSSAKGPFDHLATAICGEGVRRVQGDDVFRSLHRFNRLILRNLGLTHHQGRGVRYSMYMGVDVAEGLDAAKSQARIKNNVFGSGFVDGVPSTLGCSARGRFWSFASVRDLTDWTDWCQDIGASVTNPGISGDNVFRGAMRPRLINKRPSVPPVAIHWPESLIMQFEERMQISFDGAATSFAECDIELIDNNIQGPLKFRVKDDGHAAIFEVVFAENGARYPQREGPKANLQSGGNDRPLTELFADDPPQIDFGDGSLLIYSHLYALPDGAVVAPYDPDKIETWDWSTTNIRRESQGPERHADSIQRLVIERLLDDDGIDIIFDDDGAGEIADVVAISIGESLVSVTLWHCKYSSTDVPGARVKDLYEVCGQAQKSARWRDRPNRMITHMLKREKLRLDRGQPTRFDRGTGARLRKLKSMWQEYSYEFDVRIVQPGLSRSAVGVEGLHLLAGAETYLLETRAMPLHIIGST